VMGSCVDHPGTNCEHWQAVWSLHDGPAWFPRLGG
jgi:hypothetical protein